MPSPISLPPIAAPARFVPAQALAFGQPGEPAVAVDRLNPLPIVISMGASTAAAMAGSVNASTLAGPFQPELRRPIWITLSGEWMGSVRLLRSTDGGATRLPLTIGGGPWAEFIANANEAVGEESDAAATYYLDMQLTSGTLSYRVAQ